MKPATLPPDEHLYEGSMDIHRRIVALYPKVAERNAFFRDLHLVSPRIPRPRIGGPWGVDTDRVFCALAIRAAATKESIVLLCEAGHGEGAVALARVLLENAVLMAWQRLDPGRERLETYILFTSALHERGVETLEHFRSEFPHLFDEDEEPTQSDPSHRAVTEAVFHDRDDTWAWFPDPDKPGKLKKITVAQMFRDVMEKTDPNARTIEYDVMYHLGSQVIHTAPFSLRGLLARVRASKTFFLEPLHSTDSRLMALAISNVAMIVVLKTADDYIGLDLEADLEEIVEASRAVGAITEQTTVP